jgi:hypothetical protein
MATQNDGWDDIIRESDAVNKSGAMTDAIYAKARETLAGAYKMTPELLDQRRKEKLDEKSEADKRDKSFQDAIKDAASNPTISLEAINAYLLDQIQKLNKKFFVVEEYGGKCVVAWQQPDPDPLMLGRLLFESQSFGEFANRFSNVKVPVRLSRNGVRSEPLGRVWLDHPERRQYLRVVFAPSAAPGEFTDSLSGSKIRNLWQGFAVKPIAGSCSVFLEHLRDVVCHSDLILYEYLLNWMARAVQKPGEPGHVALVFKGKQGSGKSLVVDYLGELFGSHYMAVSQGSQVTGNFNSHLRDVCILGVNEAFFAGDPKAVGPLKALITDSTMAVEKKHHDTITAPNTLHIMVTTNEEWSIPASTDARRFCYFEVSDEMIGDQPYFDQLFTEKKNGGQAALLDFLLKRDISSFQPRHFPKTEGLRRQMAQSLPPVEAAWFECLMSGVLPGAIHGDGAEMRSSTFIKWAAARNRRWVFGDEKVGNLLKGRKKQTADSMGFRKDRDATGRQTYFLPSLPECRKIWSAKRFEYDWDQTAGAGWESTFTYLDAEYEAPVESKV